MVLKDRLDRAIGHCDRIPMVMDTGSMADQVFIFLKSCSCLFNRKYVSI